MTSELVWFLLMNQAHRTRTVAYSPLNTLTLQSDRAVGSFQRELLFLVRHGNMWNIWIHLVTLTNGLYIQDSLLRAFRQSLLMMSLDWLASSSMLRPPADVCAVDKLIKNLEIKQDLSHPGRRKCEQQR
jgi:hypothetical protein